mmetsp:Transcript_6725/g.10405  ORF Transcript_6725/g.10405 Transcript_6725/m.10405 type:complete len:203 (-) Transcript_6725:770-1378(-)
MVPPCPLERGLVSHIPRLRQVYDIGVDCSRRAHGHVAPWVAATVCAGLFVGVTCGYIALSLIRYNHLVASAWVHDVRTPRGLDIAHVHIVEDVISDDVVRAVVLIHARAFGSYCYVRFEHHVSASLVKVVTPAPVAKALHVLTQVVMNSSVGKMPQCVDASHVRQESQPDIVHVVVGNLDVGAITRAIAPRPADRDSGLAKE